MISMRRWPSIDRIARSWLEKRFAFVLVCLASIVVITNFIAMFVLPQAPGRMAEPSAELIPRLPLWSFVVALPLPIPRESLQLALTLLLISAIRFAAYGFAVYCCWRREREPLTLAIVVGSALLCFFVSLCALPNIDRDIYNYIVSGRVGALYASNPYSVPSNQFPADPIYPYASARYTGIPGDNKLPLWMLLNTALAGSAGDNVVTNLLLYRSVFLLINTLNLALIIRIFDVLEAPGGLAGVVLYAWNPIIVAYGQSKVDTLMVFFMLLSILALALSRQRIAIVSLALSIFVKLITLPLLVVYMLRELRAGRWRELVISALLIILTAAVIYLPFWNSIYLFEMHLRLLASAGGAAPPIMALVLQAGFVFAVLWIGWRSDLSLKGLIHGWALVALLFSIFLSRIGFSWYLMTLIGLVSLAVEWRMALATIALSFAFFLMNAWDSASNNVVALPELFMLPRVVIYLIFICVVGLAVMTIALRRRRLRARRVMTSG